MSKRGGATAVNGFISIGSDHKKTTKKKDDEISKKEDTLRKKTVPSKITTPSRTRISDHPNKMESSIRATPDKKETKPKSVVGKSESSITKQIDRKESIKKDVASSLKLSKKSASSDKQKMSSKDVLKSHSDALLKSKDIASPYVASRSMKPKTAQSTTQLKRHTPVAGPFKDSPLKNSVAQKNMSRTTANASGDRLRKTSQLKESSSKMKIISSTLTPTKTSSTAHKKSSNSTSKAKLKDVQQKNISSIEEESDTESQMHSRPFGEIPRSNTFTKESAAPDSLSSDMSVSQTQGDGETMASLTQVDYGEDDYKYDDDFEDYESDFEEYMESEDNSSESEDEESSSETDTSLDEDAVENKGSHLEHSEVVTNQPPLKTSLDTASSTSNNNAYKETVIEKEKSSNVEEERKMDSGSYDLASHADLKRRKQIQEIRAAIDKENASLGTKLRRKTTAVAEDEGFEEIFSQETSPALKETSYSPTEGFINFENARKKQLNQKAKAKVRKRGAILMEMIKLDIMSFNLLEIPSVPYEVFMKCYGRSNTMQIQTQTNEDAVSEEVQTDEISTTTKWTQHPVKYSSPKSPDDLLFTFSQEKLGVGGEFTINETEDWLPKLHVNSLRLHSFINNAGEMILTLLEEYERDHHFEVRNITRKRDFGFSESYVSLNVSKVGFLEKRPVSIVCFSESNSSHILTVHKPSTEPLTIQAESEGRCVLCTWSVREPSCPLLTLVASNDVASVCYHSHLVFAGLIDGAICLWDLREQSVVHARCYLKDPEWLLRSPTYITADLEKEKRHTSSIVSIKLLPESNPDDSAKIVSDKTPTQVVSLDEDGLLAIWTIVESRSIISINPGLAPWGKVRLVQSSHLKIIKTFTKGQQGAIQCRSLSVDRLKPSNLYIGTNSGQVIHCLQTSTRARPQFYSADSDGKASVTCLEFSRCGYPLLMTGDSAGKVQIYRTMTERPILELSATAVTPGPAIRCLQWSPTQPGLFFVLDADSCIHVWDLCTSDMCPQMSVPFTSATLTSLSLTPHMDSKMLAVASAKGAVDIFNLKDEFGALPERMRDEQHNIFRRYITIL